MSEVLIFSVTTTDRVLNRDFLKLSEVLIFSVTTTSYYYLFFMFQLSEVLIFSVTTTRQANQGIAVALSEVLIFSVTTTPPILLANEKLLSEVRIFTCPQLVGECDYNAYSNPFIFLMIVGGAFLSCDYNAKIFTAVFPPLSEVLFFSVTTT